MPRFDHLTKHTNRHIFGVIDLHLMCGVHALRGQHNGVIRSREALYGGFIAVYQHDGNIAIVYNILLLHFYAFLLHLFIGFAAEIMQFLIQKSIFLYQEIILQL